MAAAPEDRTLARAQDWWRTSIIDMSPGVIRFRGFRVEDLIGRVSYPQMVWLMLRGDLPTRAQADGPMRMPRGACTSGTCAPTSPA